MGNYLRDLSKSIGDELNRESLIGEIQRRGYYIDGVEVTQAIQYYHADQHLTDPADRGPDNSVRLVAYKPAWVRVYLRGIHGDRPGLTGTVAVQRRILGSVYVSQTTLTPEPPGTATARRAPPYAAERSQLGSTLNFVIPAAQMFGHLRLRVEVTAGADLDQTIVDLNVTFYQQLRLAGIMIGYDGPDPRQVSADGNPAQITLPAPALAELMGTTSTALAMMPVESTATYRLAGTITRRTPVAYAPGWTSRCLDWEQLIKSLMKAVINDGWRGDVAYFGLYPAAMPAGSWSGCMLWTFAGFGPSGDEMALAFTLGRAIWLGQALCGELEPRYAPYLALLYDRAFEPYDPTLAPLVGTAVQSGFAPGPVRGRHSGSIGEYGLDIRNGRIMDPAVFKDYMSFCTPQWVSLVRHEVMLGQSELSPATVGEDRPWTGRYAPSSLSSSGAGSPPGTSAGGAGPALVPAGVAATVAVIGTVEAGGRVTVETVARVPVAERMPVTPPSGYTLELLDADGSPLAEAPLFALTGRTAGCGCDGDAPHQGPVTVVATLPDVAPGAALRIRKGEAEVWRRTAPSAPPRTVLVRATVEQRATLVVEWEVEAAGDADAEVWLQWSAGGGREWSGLATELHGGRAEFDATALPSGSIQIRLLAHDGFHSAVSDPVAFENPRRPPVAAVLYPRDGEVLDAGRTMRLWGMGTTCTGEVTDAGTVRWTIDGVEVAHGPDVFVVAPEAGEHRCTLTVDDGDGRAEVVVRFQTVAVPDEDATPAAI